MSEAELHLLRSRLRGGILNKAQRGELMQRLPIGLIHLPDGRCARDPDAGIQASITAVFDAFAATGGIAGVLRRLLAGGIRFPQCVWGGENAGTIIWCNYTSSRVRNVLTNPAYAGAYVYGRRRCRRAPNGQIERRRLTPDMWAVVIPDHFPGYVSWTDFQAIQERLRSNEQRFGRPTAFGPPREGSALLQGRVMCGRCGSPMYVRYGNHRRPRYVCLDDAIARQAVCQSVPAIDVDAAVARLLLELMTPMAVEMTLAIQSELDRCVAESEHHYQLRITRARYESDLARRRYLLVDPANRLVAAGLEAEWNRRLAELAAVEQELAQFHAGTQEQLSAEMRRRIEALTRDLPQLWADPAVIDRERKEILALLVEDVTLLSERIEITAHVRLRGGTCRSLTVPRSVLAPRKRTGADLVAQIDRLLDGGDDLLVAQQLNDAGTRNWRGQPFTKSQIGSLRKAHGLPSHGARRLAEGYEREGQMAARLRVTRPTIRLWAINGMIERCSCGRGRKWYYRLPQGTVIVKGNGGPYPRRPQVSPAPIFHATESGAI